MRFSGRSRPLRIGEFFFYHHDDDGDGDYNDDYNDDCRYDQSTAEAFRAVQKSGEMVMIIVLYHFISCNPLFWGHLKIKGFHIDPLETPFKPKNSLQCPEISPKTPSNVPLKSPHHHSPETSMSPVKPPKALITSPWIKSKISPTPSDITQQPPDTLLYPGEKI